MPPHRVDPTVDGEAFEERDAATVEHRLHHPEHSAHVDQRRVDDDDAVPEPDVGVGGTLVVLGPAHDQFEHVVREIDALGRPGRSAREHADGDAGPGPADGRPPRRQHELQGFPERAECAARRGGQRAGWQQREVVRVTDEQGKIERRHVVPEPLGAEERVHGDDARARAQQPEERTERRRAVAQHEANRRCRAEARLPKGGIDLIGPRRQVAPRVPTPAELQGGRRRVERHDRAQPFRQLAHRTLGVMRSAPVRASSSAPSGLPRRVYMRPCSIAAR